MQLLRRSSSEERLSTADRVVWSYDWPVLNQTTLNGRLESAKIELCAHICNWRRRVLLKDIPESVRRAIQKDWEQEQAIKNAPPPMTVRQWLRQKKLLERNSSAGSLSRQR